MIRNRSPHPGRPVARARVDCYLAQHYHHFHQGTESLIRHIGAFAGAARGAKTALA